jgi:hypothetical protein
MEIRQALSNQKARSLALAGFVVFLGSWALISYTEIIPNVILPSPTDVVRAFPVLHFEEALVRSAGWSIYRVTMGFVLASLVAIPLGLLMGTFPPVKYFFAPVLDPLRFLPISGAGAADHRVVRDRGDAEDHLPVPRHLRLSPAPGRGSGGGRRRGLSPDRDHPRGEQGQIVRLVLIPAACPPSPRRFG